MDTKIDKLEAESDNELVKDENELKIEETATKKIDDVDDNITFKSLGVCPELCEACEQLKWKKPTIIQREALPVSLQGKL